jgi:hypothetical protein
MDRGKNKIFL